MNAKISDFALAKKTLEILCFQFDKEFIDVEIEFGENGPEYRDGVIYLQENGSLRKTIFSIIFLYLQHLAGDIQDEARRNVLLTALSIVKDFNKESKNVYFEGITEEELIPMRLDQHPIVWLIMKNLICPMKNVYCKNIRVLAGKSSVVDVCRLITEEEMPNSGLEADELPFVFMNLDARSEAVRSAYLLVEASRAILGDDAESVVRDLFSDYFMKDRVTSFVQMSFIEERDEKDFFATLAILCQSEELERLALKNKKDEKNIKEAQYEGNSHNWWYMGLAEKFLEPARSEDWTVYETWKPITDELKSRVETERRKHGLDEAPFELMLDVQRQMDQLGTDNTMTLQALLSDDRIW